MGNKLAIDVGGTFTDVVFLKGTSGKLSYTKTPTSLGDPSDGVLNGIKKILKETNSSAKDINYFIHGTTYATNAFLEQDGSKVALLTTEGFRDVIEIGRQKRPKLYDLNLDRPPSLVERKYRYGIKERVNSKGEVIQSIDEKQLKEIINNIKENGIKTIAVVYLHSYVNAEHELKTLEIINEIYPECNVSLSHEISPEFREFERTTTTVVNAYLKPNTKNYFSNLSNKIKDMGVKEPYIVKSSGGAMTLDTAGERVVETLLSGPAGGVTGSTFLAKKMGIENIITLDMGGTSSDVAMILNQSPKTTMESLFKGYPLKVPMIDMETVGAGGGSIGWIDEGKLLKVGPKSAGATPGPACYDIGGEEPTITDANLVLGRIDPTSFNNGEMKLNVDKAKQSFKGLMKETRKSLEETAKGVIDIANHHMAEAVRLVTVQKGHNPKDFTLFSFGGASPLHSNEIARSLKIPKVVIPKISAQMSAFGFLTADIRHDLALTQLTDLKDSEINKIKSAIEDLSSRGKDLLDDEKVKEEDSLFIYTGDLRYKGQAFEVSVNISPEDLKKGTVSILKKFQKEYKMQYGFIDESEPVEIVNFRLAAIGKTAELNLEEIGKGPITVDEKAIKEKRNVFIDSDNGFKELSVYELKFLLAGNKIEGPAIIDGFNTTILLNSADSAELDEYGNLVMYVGGDENE